MNTGNGRNREQYCMLGTVGSSGRNRGAVLYAVRYWER